MPLARIITRSHQCSRELALDLLARGYTVEVVSPDKIPDNIADLELRVDAGPDNQLIANVEVHNGDRSTSLDFIHHLKTPLADFVRRSPEPPEGIEPQTLPIAFDGESNVEDLETPVEAVAAIDDTGEPRRAFALAESAGTAGNIEESARLIPADESQQSLSEAQRTEFAGDGTATDHPDPLGPAIIASRERQAQDRSDNAHASHSRGWRWRPAFTVASAIILALVVRFGIRHAGKSAVQNPDAAASKKIESASANVNSPNPVSAEQATTKNSEKDSRVASTSAAAKISAILVRPSDATPAENSKPSPIEATVATSPSAMPAPSNKVANKNGDGLVARDTVTYLDKKYEKSAAQPTIKKKSAQTPVKTRSVKTLARKSAPHHPNTNNRRSDGIAPDTVTYLDKTPTTKTAKQN